MLLILCDPLGHYSVTINFDSNDYIILKPSFKLRFLELVLKGDPDITKKLQTYFY